MTLGSTSVLRNLAFFSAHMPMLNVPHRISRMPCDPFDRHLLVHPHTTKWSGDEHPTADPQYAWAEPHRLEHVLGLVAKLSRATEVYLRQPQASSALQP